MTQLRDYFSIYFVFGLTSHFRHYYYWLDLFAIDWYFYRSLKTWTLIWIYLGIRNLTFRELIMNIAVPIIIIYCNRFNCWRSTYLFTSLFLRKIIKSHLHIIDNILGMLLQADFITWSRNSICYKNKDILRKI